VCGKELLPEPVVHQLSGPQHLAEEDYAGCVPTSPARRPHLPDGNHASICWIGKPPCGVLGWIWQCDAPRHLLSMKIPSTSPQCRTAQMIKNRLASIDRCLLGMAGRGA